MGPQLRCRPSAAAVETGAGLNPNGVCGEGSQVMKGLLGGRAFRQLQGRGTDETVTCQRWHISAVSGTHTRHFGRAIRRSEKG